MSEDEKIATTALSEIARPMYKVARDPRDLPAYSIGEAAAYIGVPVATLRTWVRGRYYPTASGKCFFAPIIALPDEHQALLSFFNLVETHVLAAIRRKHEVALSKVRSALDYVSKQFSSPHPLADQQFETDGIDLFVEKYGQLINVSREGQIAIRDVLRAYLRRIERDEDGKAAKLYPFNRTGTLDQPMVIVIDPRISFGKPSLMGTGIPTGLVAERYRAGECIDELSADYRRTRDEIEEAIRFELKAA